jgi:hypothetical protein
MLVIGRSLRRRARRSLLFIVLCFLNRDRACGDKADRLWSVPRALLKKVILAVQDAGHPSRLGRSRIADERLRLSEVRHLEQKEHVVGLDSFSPELSELMARGAVRLGVGV